VTGIIQLIKKTVLYPVDRTFNATPYFRTAICFVH
jgi:hypothetical protein